MPGRFNCTLKAEAKVESKVRMDAEREEGRTAQISVRSTCRIIAAHKRTNGRLCRHESESNDGRRGVRRLEDGLACGGEQHQAALAAQQKEEEREPHDLRVEFASRLS